MLLFSSSQSNCHAQMASMHSCNLTSDGTAKTFWQSMFSHTNRHQEAEDVRVPTGINTHRDLIQKQKPTGHSSTESYVTASESCNFPKISASISWKPMVQHHYTAAGCRLNRSEMRDRMRTKYRRERRTCSEIFVYNNKMGKNIHCSKRKLRD